MSGAGEPSDAARRRFLQSSLASGLAVTGSVESVARAQDNGPAITGYPRLAVVQASALKINEPLFFRYPDAQSPCVAVKLGRRVPGGAGQDGSIVAFSQMCTHMGCLLSYEAQTARLKCSCHFTMFDPEKAGQMITGQATANLAQVVLEYRASDDVVHAVAVRGLIYGRQSNVM